jgi:glyoxylase-like metal-dependent hydrolase (beta-lactamase superfamily II)
MVVSLRTVVAASTLGLVITGAVAAGSRQSPAPVMDAYTRARDAIEAAVTAHGGRQRFTTPLEVRFEGDTHWRHQSPVPEPPFASTPLSATLVWDGEGRRLLYESRTEFVGGFRNHRRQVRTPAGGFDLDIARRRLTPIDGDRLADLAFVLDRLPHQVLLSALDQPAALRAAGSAQWRERPHDMVDATLRGTPIRLFIDSGTRLLGKYELLVTDTYEGDAVQVRTFDDYRAIEGLMMPRRWGLQTGGTQTQGYRLEARRADTRAMEAFVAPAGVPGWKPPATAPATRSLGAGLHFLSHISPSYHVLLVEFSDHVVVVDAPVGPAVGEQILQRAAAIAPGKPVRYVVPTHHHEDHAGAMRAFIQTGATILTAAGNRAIFERMARATFTLRPDRLSASPRAARVEVPPRWPHTLRDGAQTIEIHNIGPSPHVRDMLVVFAPREGVLFQGDLGSDVAYETSRHFLDWLRQSGLPVTTIAGTHNEPMSRADFEQLVQAIPAPNHSRTAR